MSTSRTLFSLALVALVASTTGCDTPRARARAQKGVEKYRDGDIAEAAKPVSYTHLDVYKRQVQNHHFL